MALNNGFKNFLSHFVQGLIVIAPAAITVYIVVKLFELISATFGFVPKIVHPLVDPIIITAGVVIIIYIIGRISASLIFTPVYTRIEKDIEKVPLIRIVYSSVKDIMSAFVGSKRRFNKPVLVTLDNTGNVKQMGFITQDDLSEMAIDKDYMAVYLPFSYGFSGKLMIVHKNNITPIDASAADVMKFIVSGGVTHVD